MQKEEKSYKPLIDPTLSWEPAEEEAHAGTLVVQPLEPGFGITLGNALRRVILSFIEGSAVTSVVIAGVNHEFAVLDGVVEDVLQIILNIKKLVIKNSSGQPGSMRLSKKGSGILTAADIVCDSFLEIVNKDQHIATLDFDGSLDIQLFVEVGRGYAFANWPTQSKFSEDGRIYVDSHFSPVQKVSYSIEKARVGQSIDYDKLVLYVQTNGAIDPQDTIEYAASVLRANCKFLLQGKADLKFEADCGTKSVAVGVTGVVGSEQALGVPVDLFTKPIETLELSVRAQNCLDSADIRTVLDLVNLTDEEALQIKNFGRKTLKEVKDVLVGLGLRLGMNIKTHDLKKARKDNATVNIDKFA